MPLDEARKLRNIYHILDKEYDFDGSIPQEKVIEILRMFDANPTAHDERQLLVELDVNNDLFVSFREMCSYFAVKGWVTAVESKEHKILKLRSFLEIFDVNKDGKWGTRSSKHVHAAVHRDHSLEPECMLFVLILVFLIFFLCLN